MFNPEFRRNLWCEFPGHRLLAMPVMLGLIFLTASLADSAHVAAGLYRTATVLFVFIVWFWGARNANGAISDEIREQTWDQQRLSALEPWRMTWGKLFGATAYNWYGGLICLAVAIPAGLAAQGSASLVTIAALVASGVLIHAAILTLSLHGSRQPTSMPQKNGIGWLALVLIFALFANLANKGGTPQIFWWNQAIDREFFWLASSLFFAAATVFAAWRVMSNALQVRTRPWAWPLFSLLLALYLTGIGDPAGQTEIAALPSLALIVAMVMTYAALFSEPCGPLELRRLKLRQDSGDWQGWLEYLPLWPTTLAAAFVYALLATVSAPPPPAAQSAQEMLTGIAPLALALMLCRDCCLLLFFAFAPQPGRPTWTTLLALGALDFLLPFSAKAAGMTQLSWLILPLGSGNPWAAVLVMTLQAGLALGLLSWRWRRVR
ncbi:MAG: hypothetical protein HGA96_09365 [Desulfobulbaceae bacterium]|nr:hypothetical protein [Desulfobulbaceae bacterium]